MRKSNNIPNVNATGVSLYLVEGRLRFCALSKFIRVCIFPPVVDRRCSDVLVRESHNS